MPFDYYKRLSARQRRIYDQSDAVASLRVPKPERMTPAIDAIAAGLRRADRGATSTAVDGFTRQLLETLRVSMVRVRVLAKRPSHNWGELHGLYEPGEGAAKPLITVWMRTAQRREVVAFKTFLRTLLHEIGHHLDYELLQLEDSLHTQGFYKRESSLFRQLIPDPKRYEAGGATDKKSRAPAQTRSTKSTKQTTATKKPTRRSTPPQHTTEPRPREQAAASREHGTAKPRGREPEVVQPSLFEE